MARRHERVDRALDGAVHQDRGAETVEAVEQMDEPGTDVSRADDPDRDRTVGCDEVAMTRVDAHAVNEPQVRERE